MNPVTDPALNPFSLDELDYELPEELIAQAPLARRDASRLLVVDAFERAVAHDAIRALPSLLPPALFVVNDTRVIPARLRGHKPSGGAVELLLVDRLSLPGRTERWRCLGRSSKGMREGLEAQFGEGPVTLHARVESKLDEGDVEVSLGATGAETVLEAAEALGELPLPPYVRRAPEEADRERYQTVFAAVEGAVAAPTAGLHFTPELLAAMKAAGHTLASVTLHVGPGTFRPVKADRLEDHEMHEERYVVPEATRAAIAAAREEGRPVVAVGTTVVRTLESAADDAGLPQAGPGATRLFIWPPYEAKVVDHLLTNFHLPRSTLLALVMALGGVDTLRDAYRAAVAERYRFFSYGDAMLLRGIRA